MELVLQGLVGVLHVLAAVVWVGSIIYHQFAVRPALKPLDAGKALAVDVRVTRRFTIVTWVSFAVLAVTGFFAVFSSLDAYLPLTGSPAAWVLLAKLALVALLGAIFVLQHYALNPKARKAALSAHRGTWNLKGVITERGVLFKVYVAVGVAVIAASVALSGILG